jgi:hypothetical protein
VRRIGSRRIHERESDALQRRFAAAGPVFDGGEFRIEHAVPLRCDGRQQIGGRFGAGFAAVGEAFGFDAGGFALGGSGFFEQRQGARQSGSRRQAFEGHLLDAAADGKIGVLPAFLISLLAQRFGLAAQIGGERGASLFAQAADASLIQPHFGGGLRDDGARRITTTASHSSCGGGSQSSRELYDPLGRLVRTEVDSGDSTVDIVERQYDEHGRLWRVSHPYRSGNALWTTYSYDAVDRLVEAAYPENSGTEQRSYSGNQTTIVEANGSQRRLTVDGLGRIQTASEFGAAQYDVTDVHLWARHSSGGQEGCSVRVGDAGGAFCA